MTKGKKLKTLFDTKDIHKTDYVYIEWMDAASQSGWQHIENPQIGEPFWIISVGFLVKETPLNYTVAGGVSQDGQLIDPLTIPKGWAQKIKTLTSPLLSRRKK